MPKESDDRYLVILNLEPARTIFRCGRATESPPLLCEGPPLGPEFDVVEIDAKACDSESYSEVSK
jgi:hypothetical protein